MPRRLYRSKMIRSKSSIFSRNNSRVGNAIKLSSETGTPSCFSGGRKIVKCTKSTELSDLSKLRHVRPPGCGSPDTNRTRKRSRTPFIWISAVLLRSVNSLSSVGTVNWMTFRPPCGNVTGTSISVPIRTLKRCGGPPSTDTSSSAKPSSVSGTAPMSSILRVRVTASSMMAKAGAPVTIKRRSQSVSLPVSKTCIGAGRLTGIS